MVGIRLFLIRCFSFTKAYFTHTLCIGLISRTIKTINIVIYDLVCFCLLFSFGYQALAQLQARCLAWVCLFLYKTISWRDSMAGFRFTLANMSHWIWAGEGIFPPSGQSDNWLQGHEAGGTSFPLLLVAWHTWTRLCVCQARTLVLPIFGRTKCSVRVNL